MKLNRLTFLVLALLLVGPLVFAQGTTGLLTGVVTHDGSPLPGVTVTISSPSLQGVRTAVTNENGGYNLPALPPGDYVVTFEMNGMQTVTQRVRVAVAQTSRSDASMRLSGIAEAITVTASTSPVIESSQVAATFTGAQVDELPVGRTIGATAQLSPGVTTAFGRANQLQISGAPGYDNLILVNGVVVNENLRAQIHNLFIEDAIQETTVLTGGISAEYGRFTGGVVSSLTKSGGNEFSGSLRNSLSNSSWRQKTPIETADRISDLREVYEATLGGFVMKDRLWFFAGGRFFETTAQANTTETLFSFAQPDEEKRIEGKLTAAITPSHNVVVSYIDVSRDLLTWFGAIYDLRSTYNTSQPNTLGTIQYSGILTPNFLVEASYAEKDFTFVGSGAPTRDRIQGTLLVDNQFGRRFWSPTFCGVCSDEERNNDSWLLKGSYYLGTGNLGSHSITAGVENFAETRLVNNHQSGSDWRILLTGVVRDSAGRIVMDPNGSPYPLFRDNTILQWNPILFESPGSDLQVRSIFVNDKWDFTDRWTFNLGLRYDRNDATDSFGNVVSNDSEISPRLGATFDLMGDGRHRVHATYGRYVSKIQDGNVGGAASPAGNPASITFFWRGPDINTGDGPYMTPDQALALMWAHFDAPDGTPFNLTTSNFFDHPWIRTASIPGVSTLFLSPITSPSMDEITLGYGASFGRNAFVRADLIAREWQNFYENRLTLATGKTPDGRGDVSHMGNTDEIERKYRGLHLQGGWRPGRTNVGGSYTYATLRGNDLSEGAATATIPNLTLSGWYPEYTGYTQRLPIGSLDGDVRHRAKIWAGYDLPLPGPIGSVNITALHDFASGSAYGAAGTISPTAYEGAPANPGYTLSRLGNQTYWFTDRDGFRTSDFHSTDLALNYRLPLWRVELFANASMFNVLNNDKVMTPNSAIRTRQSAGAASGLSHFNPFTGNPVECPQGAPASQCASMGAHWQKAPQFGTGTSVLSFQVPREYNFTVGVRF
jgi:outer membrane receptor protein involved in Fe transport